MPSLLFNKHAEKMKQRLHKISFSCSSSASTSIVAFSSGGRGHRPPHPPRSRRASTSNSSSSGSSSSRFLLNSSRLQSDSIVDSLPPPSFIDRQMTIAAAVSSPDQQQPQAVLKRSCSTRGQHQVVVLKVSLHCKGCAGKVKKHIAKMEGVTSFDIDIATKKVTVMGDVTPLGVLNCISKIKSAQFWPASSSSSSCSSPPRASASF